MLEFGSPYKKGVGGGVCDSTAAIYFFDVVQLDATQINR